MRHFLVSVGFGALICAGAVGHDVHPAAPASRVPTCDTTYVGPPGGSVYDVANWTNGLPRAGDVACFPDDQRRVGSVNPPDRGGLVSAGVEVRIIPSTREQTGGSDDPPYEACRSQVPPSGHRAERRACEFEPLS